MTADDWRARLADQVARAVARRAARRAVREQHIAARAAGLRARHATKLARAQGDQRD